MQYFNIESFRLLDLPSQAEVMSSWEGENSNPLVSIVCITYNQEKYIRDTIKGLLVQKTTFPFEIIIHDDASIDSTSKIIEEYKSLYPNIIKVIIQKENQYSKSPNSVLKIATSIAVGKYIALCEGDDFWIDKNKLEKQVKLLEQYSNIKICFTACIALFNSNNQYKCNYHSKSIKIFTPDEVIRGGGGFMPTCSLVIHSSIFKNLPTWFFDTAPVGDVFLQILSSIEKGALYLPELTCVYRIASEGSWTMKDSNRKDEVLIQNRIKVIECLQEINKNTHYLYNKSFKYVESLSYCSTAFFYLSKSEYLLARRYINLSWDICENINLKQFILKRFFLFSPILRLYLSYKQKKLMKG